MLVLQLVADLLRPAWHVVSGLPWRLAADPMISDTEDRRGAERTWMSQYGQHLQYCMHCPHHEPASIRDVH